MTGLSPSSFTPTKQQLGIKTLALNENQYLAIGSYDEFLRIIDSNTGKIFAREKLGAIIPDMFSAVRTISILFYSNLSFYYRLYIRK